MYVCVCVCVCVYEREKMPVFEQLHVLVCECASLSVCDRVYVCMCLCVREKEREERQFVCVRER